MKVLVLLWRLFRAVTHAVRGFWTIRTVFPRLELHEREQRVHAWARQMIAITGIDLVVQGATPSSGPVLLVANHISWLDIVVMHAAHYCRFVSKADVQQWPFISTMADGAGTLYLERQSRRDAHRVVRRMAERLQAGDVLAVFPEGTTGDGVQLKPFHANLIEAAIQANVPVQPVALKFLDLQTGATSFAPRYIDDDALGPSIWRTLTAPPLRAVVTFGALQFAEGRTRREWSQSLRSDIEELRLL
jgi:1-acyl-sn-glycerol-3-phosphate acyltransferase